LIGCQASIAIGTEASTMSNLPAIGTNWYNEEAHDRTPTWSLTGHGRCTKLWQRLVKK